MNGSSIPIKIAMYFGVTALISRFIEVDAELAAIYRGKNRVKAAPTRYLPSKTQFYLELPRRRKSGVFHRQNRNQALSENKSVARISDQRRTQDPPSGRDHGCSKEKTFEFPFWQAPSERWNQTSPTYIVP